MLPQVAGALRDGGHDLEILLSRDFDEAEAMAAQAVADGVDVLAVMGGDGMMHLGRQHRRRRPIGPRTARTTLGLIPAGTGNDLCRGIGLNPDDPTAAAAVIAAGHTRPVDVMRIGARYVGGVLATGFDALVNRRANEMAWPRGLVPVHPGHLGRAAGVLAAALPAGARRPGTRAGGDAGGGRQHRLVRRRDADLPAGRSVRRPARRDDHPSGRPAEVAPAAAGDVLGQVRPRSRAWSSFG